MESNSPETWKAFKATTKRSKHEFFDNRIKEIVESNKRPWDLKSWTGPHSVPSLKRVSFQGKPCKTEAELFSALHSIFTSASGRSPDMGRLGDTVNSIPEREWNCFSEAKLVEALTGSNRSSPGPDHVTWTHLKSLVKTESICTLFTSIANTCLFLGHWPGRFKESVTVVISKPGKPRYDTTKMFRPIVLLNTLGKLFEKMITR